MFVREGPVDGAANPSSLLSPSASNNSIAGGTDSPGKAIVNDSSMSTTPASPSSLAGQSTISQGQSQTPRNRQGSSQGSRGAYRGVIPRAVEETWARIRHLNE